MVVNRTLGKDNLGSKGAYLISDALLHNPHVVYLDLRISLFRKT